MALEVIKQIKEAELLSEEKRQQTAVKVKSIISEARNEGLKEAAKIENDTTEKINSIENEARETSKSILREMLEETRKECERLRVKAENHYIEVTAAVVERIVNKWQ